MTIIDSVPLWILGLLGCVLLSITIRRYPVGAIRPEGFETTFRWPPNMFSLSHIALPFPESDTLYGSGEAGEKDTLGNLALRGERGAIRIPPGDMLRQRWNPFYALLEHHASPSAV